MKPWWIIALLIVLARAETPALDQHAKNAEKLASDQDELAADVQQLIAEQTSDKVIELLEVTQDLMGQAQEKLADHHTDGPTIAIQTEILEKIYEAAKAKQQQQGQAGESKAGGMMRMLEQMLGKGEAQNQPQKGNQAGNQGGNGMTGDSNSGNQANNGAGNGEKQEERRVPKATGTSGTSVPEEFRQALDAYNRGATQLTK